MSTESTSTVTGAGTGPVRVRVRAIVVVVLFIIATVLTPLATIGQWGHKTVLDSETYLATVGPLIDDPVVQDSLSEAITSAITARIDTKSSVAGLLDQLLPNSGIAQGLSAPIAMGINGLIGNLVHSFVSSPQFAKAWITLNSVAQKGLIALLEGKDGGPVQIQGDDLVLDISASLVTVQDFLVEQGVPLVDKITIPEGDRQIVLAKAPGLRQLQAIYGFANPLLALFPLIVALLFAIAIGLSRRRAGWVIATGVVSAAWAVLLLMAIDKGQQAFTNQLQGTVFGPASVIFYDTLLRYLIAGVQALALLGALGVVAGWFGGRSRPARAIRTPLTRGLAELGSHVPAPAVGQAATRYFQPIAWAVYVVIGFLLLRNGLVDYSQVIWASLLALGLICALTALRAAGSGRPAATVAAEATPAA